MAAWSRELRERLLRAGVAPRHANRYLTELREHWADLSAEEQRSGHGLAEAESRALVRLGPIDVLAQTMIDRRELRSWTARAPWAVLTAGPVLGLLLSWLIAMLILASGWNWFLQGSSTPFVPIHGFAVVYFAIGRALYYGAPLLCGWAFLFLAGRQRVRAVWPIITGSLAVALLGATGAVDVRPPTVPGHTGDVGIRFLPPASQLADAAGRALLLFLLIALPYLIWRLTISRSEPLHD